MPKKGKGRYNPHIHGKAKDPAKEKLGVQDGGKKKSGKEEIEVKNVKKSNYDYSSWTGKTAVTLLHEYCQKNKLQRPQYRSVRSVIPKKIRQRVVLTESKAGGKSTFYESLDRSECHDYLLDAKHFAATATLHALQGNIQLHRVLPPPQRDYWNKCIEMSKQKREVDEKVVRRMEIMKVQEVHTARLQKSFEMIHEVILNSTQRKLVEDSLKLARNEKHNDEIKGILNRFSHLYEVQKTDNMIELDDSEEEEDGNEEDKNGQKEESTKRGESGTTFHGNTHRPDMSKETSHNSNNTSYHSNKNKGSTSQTAPMSMKSSSNHHTISLHPASSQSQQPSRKAHHAQPLGSHNSTGPVLSHNAQQRIHSLVCRAGFRPAHVSKAMSSVKNSTPFSSEEDFRKSVLDWLTLNVPEEDLPTNFSAPKDVEILPFGQSDSLSHEVLEEKYRVNRLEEYGFSKERCQESLSKFQNEAHALQMLYSELVSCPPFDAPFLSVDTQVVPVPEISPQSERETQKSDERIALESIYGQDFKIIETGGVNEGASFSIAMSFPRNFNVPGLSFLEIRVPPTSQYPTESPIILFKNSKLPGYIKLCITVMLHQHAEKLVGECVGYHLTQILPEIVRTVVKNPPLPKSQDPSVGHTTASQHNGKSNYVTSRNQNTASHHQGRKDLSSSDDVSKWRKNQANHVLKGQYKMSQRPDNQTIPSPLPSPRKNPSKQESDAPHPSPHIMQARKNLPSWTMKSDIISCVQKNQVVVITGETGCGKTTQVPQFILDSSPKNPHNIICTQPRRIAAVSVASRVAVEHGDRIGECVGYQIRNESKKSKMTSLLFCTTGVLLRRLQSNQILEGITHIIIDEVHERSIESDFLLVLMKTVVLPARPDMKLILMSATVDPVKFSEYFGKCPIIHISSRTFPVSTHYLEDVLEFLGPDGFKMENNVLRLSRKEFCHRMTAGHHFPCCVEGDGNKSGDIVLSPEIPNEENFEKFASLYQGYSLKTVRSLLGVSRDSVNDELIVSLVGWLLDVPSKVRHENGILIFVAGIADISRLCPKLTESFGERVVVYGLHSSVSDQRSVFTHPPQGKTKVVVSTNIAETSITIDDIVNVIDTGKVKEMHYDAQKDVSALCECWISTSSENQRLGRAGRVREGHCYRLYTRWKGDHFAPSQAPEIHRVSLRTICMHVLMQNFGNPFALLSETLDPPCDDDILLSLKSLYEMGAIDSLGAHKQLTPLGRYLALIPSEPRIAKCLVYSCLLHCVDPLLTITAAMCERSPFVSPVELRDEANSAKQSFGQADGSDHMAIVHAYEKWRENGGNDSEYCASNFLSSRVLRSITVLRKSFARDLRDARLITAEDFQAYVENSKWKQRSINRNIDAPQVVRACICAGLYPNVASIRRPPPTFFKTVSGAAIERQQHPKTLKLRTKNGERVFFHPSSVNFSANYSLPFAVYSEHITTSREFIRETTLVGGFELLLFGGPISVNHVRGTVFVGGSLMMRSSARVAVLFAELRKELDRILLLKLRSPATIDLFDNAITTCVENLLMRKTG